MPFHLIVYMVMWKVITIVNLEVFAITVGNGIDHSAVRLILSEKPRILCKVNWPIQWYCWTSIAARVISSINCISIHSAANIINDVERGHCFKVKCLINQVMSYECLLGIFGAGLHHRATCQKGSSSDPALWGFRFSLSSKHVVDFRILCSLWLSFCETGDDRMMNKNYFAWLRIKDPGRTFLPGLCLCATAHSCEESTCSFTSVRTMCSFDYKWCLTMSFIS